MRPEVWAIVGVVGGGLLSLLGSMLVTWLQIRASRKSRFDQLVAEKQIQLIEDMHARCHELRRQMGPMGSPRCEVGLGNDRREWARRFFEQ